MRDTLHGAFYRGTGFGVALICLHQDWLGLDAYVSYVKAHWIQVPYQIWVILILLLLVAEYGSRKGDS